MRILYPIYSQMSLTTDANVIAQMQAVGLEVVFLENYGTLRSSDCVYVERFLDANSFVNHHVKPKGLTLPNINIDLYYKDGLQKMWYDVGLPTLDTYDASLNNIQTHFTDRPFIIKPKCGFGADTRFSKMAYIIFDNVDDYVKRVSEDDHLFDSTDYIAQESVQRGDGTVVQLYTQVYVNPYGEMFHEGISRQVYLPIDTTVANIADRWSVPKFGPTVQSVRHAGNKTDRNGLLSQIKKLVDYYKITSAAIRVQALVDVNDEKCVITDFGYGIVGALQKSPNESDKEYLRDKLKYMFYGTPIQLIDDHWYTYYTAFKEDGILTKEQAVYGKTIGITPVFYTFNDTTDWWNAKTKYRLFSVKSPTQEGLKSRIQTFKENTGWA